MMTFVQNKEELTGVLCHEVSHTIHHDVWDLYVKSRRVSIWSTVAQVLLGQKSQIVSFGINLLANIQVLRFSRDVEHSADMTGAHICAQSGVTPWGMVWMMKRFLDKNRSNGPEFLSDHPTDSHRIADLEKLFADEPQTFARFNASLANATPMHERGLRSQYAAENAASIPVKPRAKPTCPPGWKFCPQKPG
jgi:predicted Zn-dependent protease